jgi:starch-binding outer membrane protein, SusD/RagB family
MLRNTPITIGRIAAMAMTVLAACTNLSDPLLEAEDPDIINPSSVTTPEAADALRIGAIGRFRGITAGGEGAWMLGGLMADEWKSGDTFLQRNETDQRQVQEVNGNVQGMLREIYRARNNAREAINALVKYKPTPNANRGELWFVMGMAETMLAENFCNGTPLGDASTGEIIYGPGRSNQEVYTLALAHYDTALALSGATDAASTTVRNAILIARARTQVQLGQFAAAATTVAPVPTTYRYNATFALTSGDNGIWNLNANARRWVVGDSFDVGGIIANAIPFASARDPRVPTTGSSIGTSSAGKSFDGSTNFLSTSLWGRSDPAPILSGIDARLIEAEARLQADDYAGMMTILNALRAAPQNLGAISTPAMAALPVPTSRNAAIDLYFREKAFWQFSRGYRMTDLRRLVRQYGRNQASVFPNGQFFKGGNYGVDTNFPVTVDEQNNPEFKGCTNRNA